MDNPAPGSGTSTGRSNTLSQHPSGYTMWQWWYHGVVTWLSFAVLPLGRIWFVGEARYRTPERYQAGLVLVLPGIEGRSFLNISLRDGLIDGGVPAAIEIHDWTWGAATIAGINLIWKSRNRKQAQHIAERLMAYRSEFPDRPIALVGHSGGAAMVTWVLEALPADFPVAGAVLVAPAISPAYAVGAIANRTQRGLHVFSSVFDVLFLGLGTLVVGTLDRRHTWSAGMVGFSESAANGGPVTRHFYRLRDGLEFHLGGHFGCVHRVFVAQSIAPIVREWMSSLQKDSDGTRHS